MNLRNQIVARQLAKSNPWDYNITKACEELSELSEVLLKKLNKRGGVKEPSDKEVVDEIGDVIIRMEILSDMFGRMAVRDRVAYKCDKFAEYLSTNKYKKI